MGTGSDLWNQLETFYNKQDWAGFASLFASDAVHIDFRGRQEGREAIVAYFEEGTKAFPDIKLETLLLLDNEHNVVAEASFRGTHTGSRTLPDGTVVAPTGKSLEMDAVSVCTIRDGKFAYMRDYCDSADVTRQLSG